MVVHKQWVPATFKEAFSASGSDLGLAKTIAGIYGVSQGMGCSPSLFDSLPLSLPLHVSNPMALKQIKKKLKKNV